MLIIGYLFSLPQPSCHIDKIPSDTNEQSLVYPTREEDKSSQNLTSMRKIGGIAATLMLHSPTWFQRRYTFMVENIVDNIPQNWVIQVFYTGNGQSLKGITVNRGLQKHLDTGKLVLTTIPDEIWQTKRKRYQLMTERWLWANMLADKVLIFGGSAVICSNSPYRITDFLHFDYIGAPWKAFKGVGGEGGISVRNRQLMLRVIDFELAKAQDEQQRRNAYKEWGQEDRFFVSRMLEMGKRGLLTYSQAASGPDAAIGAFHIASYNDSLRFAGTGSTYNEEVWAVSGTLPGLAFDARDRFLGLCPEIKIFYPALHDPHCFGASPDAEGCAASICALKPKTQRRGGC